MECYYNTPLVGTGSLRSNKEVMISKSKSVEHQNQCNERDLIEDFVFYNFYIFDIFVSGLMRKVVDHMFGENCRYKR